MIPFEKYFKVSNLLYGTCATKSSAAVASACFETFFQVAWSPVRDYRRMKFTMHSSNCVVIHMRSFTSGLSSKINQDLKLKKRIFKIGHSKRFLKFQISKDGVASCTRLLTHEIHTCMHVDFIQLAVATFWTDLRVGAFMIFKIGRDPRKILNANCRHFPSLHDRMLMQYLADRTCSRVP